MRVTHPRPQLAAPALLLAAASAACSSTPPATVPQRSTVAVSHAAAGPSPSTPSQQALAAYRAMWGDVQELSMTSDYTNPRLGDHLDGQAYTTISENMSVDKARGIVGVGAPILHPRVLAASDTTVTLADCMDDTNWLEAYQATGKLVDSVPGGHRYTTATVTDENGTWKVTAIDTRGDGSCT